MLTTVRSKCCFCAAPSLHVWLVSAATIASVVVTASAACTGLAESCRNLYNPGGCAIGSGVNSCDATQSACEAICGSVSGCYCHRVSEGCDSIWCEYEYWCQPSTVTTCSSFDNRADCNDREGCEWEDEDEAKTEAEEEDPGMGSESPVDSPTNDRSAARGTDPCFYGGAVALGAILWLCALL